ncbi:hypothetical protein EDC01DRAFT_788026 [Geopyxis carbonaria]|nr:hypothetical protein EDC01DRAFT_788026 [Geopyxis carbonaria]
MVSYLALILFWWIASFCGFIVFVLRVRLLLRQGPNSRHVGFRAFATPQDVCLALTCLTILLADIFGTYSLTLIQKTIARIYRENPIATSGTLELFLKPEEVGDIVKWAYMSYLMSTVSLWMSKCTLSVVYLNVWKYLRKSLKILVLGTTVYIALTFLAIFFMILFWCGRPSNNWAYTPLEILGIDCMAILDRPLYIMYAVFSVSSDILLLITGMTIFHSLEISSRRQRASIVFIVIIGVMSMVSSLARSIVMSRYIENRTLFGLGSLANVKDFSLWVSMESFTALLACTLPTLRGMLNQEFTMRWPRMLRSRTSKSVGESSGQSTELRSLTVGAERMAVGVPPASEREGSGSHV